jgi:hypothetical protein
MNSIHYTVNREEVAASSQAIVELRYYDSNDRPLLPSARYYDKPLNKVRSVFHIGRYINWIEFFIYNRIEYEKRRWRDEYMNITDTGTPSIVVAKVCGHRDKEISSDKSKKKITYSVAEEYHSLSLDKKEITLSELYAYERLLKYTKDASDEEIIVREIAELKMTLDLLP